MALSIPTVAVLRSPQLFAFSASRRRSFSISKSLTGLKTDICQTKFLSYVLLVPCGNSCSFAVLRARNSMRARDQAQCQERQSSHRQSQTRNLKNSSGRLVWCFGGECGVCTVCDGLVGNLATCLFLRNHSRYSCVDRALGGM